MSAYIVDRAHIAAMVRLGLSGPTGRVVSPGTAWHTLTWYADDPRETAALATDSADYFRRLAAIRRELTHDNAQRVAYMLAVANVASVAHRYPDDTPDTLPGRMDHWWTDPAPVFDITHARPLSAVDGLAVINAYRYQACELPGWEGSEAAAFCDALRDALIRALPGYDDAPWTIDDDEPAPAPAPVLAPEPTSTAVAPDPAAAIADAGRAATIAAIRDALRRRTGRPWSVTGGRGTAWGWIRIDAPPRRKVGRFSDMTEEDAATLAGALGLEWVSANNGVSIPSGSDYWAEYIDRAEGRTPTRYGVQYWD